MKLKNLSSKNLQIILVVVLAAIAVFLGSQLLNKNTGNDTSTSPTQQQDNNSGSQITPFSSNVPSPDTNLTADEKAVLDIPIDGTPDEKQEHFELAVRLAQETDVLDITDCHPRPVVTKVNAKDTLKVKNGNDEKHFIAINQENIFEIPANTTKEITLDFKEQIGLHGYGCDASPNAAGLFIVE